MNATSLSELVETKTVPSVCRNCGRVGMAPFYRAKNVPTHSCLLMASREEAIAHPRGSILLGFCESCGFIANLHFDPALNAYSPDYEETQHFSPRFVQFAGGLVDRLVRDYHVRGKTILEIGCGKAEFLAMLCKAGNNRGIGIDPSCRPERLAADDAARITLIRDVYAENHGHLGADVICCRHTLEHIQPTREFLRGISRSIGDRFETLVFFEVPDTRRLLREQAFWDIYYEHCSYFTAGSLARLFRSCGFEILHLQRDFGDQYLWIVARPCGAPSKPPSRLEDDLEDTVVAVRKFPKAFRAQHDRWRARLRELSAEGKRTVVWGAGSKCVSFLTALSREADIEYAVDINPYKQGKFLPGTGHEVVAPEFLKHYRPDAVVVMNPIYRAEIRRSLEAMGVEARLLPVQGDDSKTNSRFGQP